MSSLLRSRRLVIFAAGPTRIGMMIPASAASIGAAQRSLVAGMHHDRVDRRALLRPGDQTLIFRFTGASRRSYGSE